MQWTFGDILLTMFAFFFWFLFIWMFIAVRGGWNTSPAPAEGE